MFSRALKTIQVLGGVVNLKVDNALLTQTLSLLDLMMVFTWDSHAHGGERGNVAIGLTHLMLLLQRQAFLEIGIKL